MTETQSTSVDWRQRAARGGALALAIVMVFAVVFIGMLYALQGRLIYPRTAFSPPPPGWVAADMVVPEAGTIRSWWKAPANGRPTVIFFHGNAAAMPAMVAATRGFGDHGVGVLAVEYPGYAGNPGTPGEKVIKAEADVAMAWLDAHGIAPNRLLIVGNSIGAGPAIQAATHPHLGLAIISGVADMRSVAKKRVGPLSGLVRDRWENADALRAVKGPVFVIHGTDDTVVPYEQGEKLAKAAKTNIIMLPGSGQEIAYNPVLQQQIRAAILTATSARPK